MNKLLYRLLYRFTRPGWDTGITPPEVVAAFSQNDLPAGPALDLGCGTGTNTIYMARQGRQAYGIDFVPRAIEKARAAARRVGVAQRAQFFVGDVTQLDRLNLPRCAFALDMGCFHGLSDGGQQRYAEVLAAQLVPGARYMLYTLLPHSEAGLRFGVARAQVEDVFAPHFKFTRVAEAHQGRLGANWYWLTRR